MVFCLMSIALFHNHSQAQIINVPADQPGIQAGINAASNGDTVLVEPGTYFENINFRGKNIVVASLYILNGDRNIITNTIINGSQPVHPDSASCVLIISGEDSTTVLQGFTITRGSGTKWRDEHGAGTYYEGGGILITLSSPIIKNNIIYFNSAIRTGSGVTSAGGGGIRVGDSNPTIINNIIMSNSGMYGGGIVLNYTGGTVKNNIIYNNTVYEAVPGTPTFGGGGIWVYNTIPGAIRIIENNTIIGNTAYGTGSSVAGRGGGILLNSITATVTNNIIWGNTANSSTYSQISPNASTHTHISYCDIMNGKSRPGEIHTYPEFTDSGFYLEDNSPCIDSGHSGWEYWDPAIDPEDRFNSKPPSKGERRNDIGAYGGPGSDSLPFIPNFSKGDISDELDFGEVVNGESGIKAIAIENLGTQSFQIDSVVFSRGNETLYTIESNLPLKVSPFENDSLFIKWTPAGESNILEDSLWIYHDTETFQNPVKIILKGERIEASTIENLKDKTGETSCLTSIYPNPIFDNAIINYSLKNQTIVSISIYNPEGKKIETLLSKNQIAGNHHLNFNRKNFQKGMYLIRLQTNYFTDVKAVVLQ